MKSILRFVWGFALFGAALTGSAADDYKEAADLERAANSWKKGEPIPLKLLDYRGSWGDFCFPNPRGTEMLFGAITNYSLLWHIALLPEIDLRVFSNAVNQAVFVAGPNRFFGDLAATVKKRPELEPATRIKMLRRQSKARHIVVDSLYITFADMSPDSARKVLDDISRELREGKPWHDVYWKFMEKHEYPYEYKSGDGTIIKGTRSKIGNLGDFLLAANHNPLFSFREDSMPKKHVKKLFGSKVGDILILFDKEDLSSFPTLSEKQTGERYVLHRVREVYGGM
jgi:hypothetical protein